MFLKTLSGRFLILTVIFVMIAEVLIFVPSVARYRQDYLLSRLERAQIAALSQIAAEDMISDELEAELLQTAEVFNVVLRRDEVRQLVLSSPMPATIDATYDLRDPPALTLMRDALHQLWDPDPRILRIIGEPVRGAGLQIEVTLASTPLRQAMIDYGLRILLLSAVISAVTAGLLFLAVRAFLVLPIRHLVDSMQSYAEAPEDARRIVDPSARVLELHEAEKALQAMQTQLTQALRQKDRLAQVGEAVAKISHDLRNILTSAQLFADRMETSADPAVQRAAPKLVGSITRAINLCEATLAFGKAEEPPPALGRVRLAEVVGEAVEGERLASGEAEVSFAEDIPATMVVRADAEQLHRVLTNLLRNARQAIEASGRPGEIAVRATEDETSWTIRVTDTGPGLPPRVQEKLFRPFHSGARKGGTGLGLAIAADLVRGHGGRLDLVRTGADGTEFAVVLPKSMAVLADSAA